MCTCFHETICTNLERFYFCYYSHPFDNNFKVYPECTKKKKSTMVKME